jgi:hypothetical protein
MTPHESHLQSDGTVFPPVTPDPPLPPGQEEVVVPELMPRAVVDTDTVPQPESATGTPGTEPTD